MNNDWHAPDKVDIFALGASIYELATGQDLPTGLVMALLKFGWIQACSVKCEGLSCHLCMLATQALNLPSTGLHVMKPTRESLLKSAMYNN